jgi:hypothetical protein
MAIRTSLNEMQIGDKISCEYVASSGSIGTFSNIGSATKGFLSVTTPSSTPNGSFYFIHTGYDHKGRMKLVADRNIQSSITWDTLNTSGIATRSGVKIYFSGITMFNFSIRLLTGGTNSGDTDNEWNKIIVSSTLGETISAGDNSVWNWNGLNSWTFSTYSASSANRTLRGNTAASTWSSSGTSGTAYFRPVLVIENLNEAPILNLSTDADTTHFTPVTISGVITDGENNTVQYRILLNDIVIADWSVLTTPPVNVNYTISGDLFLPESNTIKFEAKDSLESKNTWTKIVNFTNEDITASISVDKESTFADSILLSGQINDFENDTVQYRISINEVVKYDWTPLSNSPLNVNVNIPFDYLDFGLNTILFEYRDVFGANSSWTASVVRKSVDSFYISESNCFNYSINLKAGGVYTSYIKVDGPDKLIGYIKDSSLLLNLLNGDDNTKVIKIAPITTDWSSSTATLINLPTIDIYNEVGIQLTNSTGALIIDTTELSEKMTGKNLYGVALYSVLDVIETSVENISTTLDYVPTVIQTPSVIRSTSIRLDWLPIISDQYTSTALVRASSMDFTDQVVVFETEDKSIISYIDKSLTPESLYYYKILVGVSNSESINFSTPEAGYKLVRNQDGSYFLVPAEGIAFDDPTMDYNFYTTPDKVIIRSYSMGQQIGGRSSDIQAVEVINFYTDVNYEITISAIESNGLQVLPNDLRNAGIFQDCEDPEWCTSIQFSESSDFGTFFYPLVTALNSNQRKIIYFKLKPSIYINVGQKTFKIVVNAKPI